VRHFRASADVLTVNPPSVTPTAISVPRLTNLWPPHVVVSTGHMRGASLLLHWFKILPFVFCNGSKEAHYRRARWFALYAPEVRHTNRMTCGLGSPCHRLGLSSAAAPRRHTTSECSGSLYRRVWRFALSAPEVRHTNCMTCGPGPPCHRLGCLGAHRARFSAVIEGRTEGFP
jgi:hypothetical protein